MNPLIFTDERFKETVWDSKISIKIEVSNRDLVSSNIPLTLYYSIPRMAYLTSLFGDIIKNFENYITANLEDIWLEYNNIPLKWQYPLGIIVDSLGINIENGPVPIIVHVRQIPDDKVLKYTSLDSLRYYYINSLKEANIIKFPKENKIMNLNPQDTGKLKDIVYSNDPKMIKDFRQIMNVINDNGFVPFAKYPVKLVFSQTDIVLTKPIEISQNAFSTFTMGDYLKKVLGNDNYEDLKKLCNIIIHGIEIEENMNFIFYYSNFLYMDNFLYISFVEKEKKNES
jgi:autophagy-related protein 5